MTWGPRNLLLGTESFLGAKWPGRGSDHPPHPASRLKKEYSCTSTSSLGLQEMLQDELYMCNMPVPVAARSKACVCGRSLSVIAGSNPAWVWMFVVSVVCCQVEVSETG
jgi:hypothetical protein